MSHSRWLRSALAAGACVAWLAVPAGLAVADESPNNAELYRMILELQASQQQLVDDAAKARAEAARAQQQLETTQQELEAARKQLEASAPVAATPAVSAAPEDAVFVKEADLPRGLGFVSEIHVLRATDNNQDFATLSTDTGAILAQTSNKIIQSNYETSYKLGATYSPGGATDFAISYQRFDNTKGSAKLTPPFEAPDGNVYTSLIASLAPPAFGQDAESATANDGFGYTSVDAEVGENLAVGENLNLRLFGGIRYADLNEHLEAFYFGGDFDPTFGGRSNSDFGFWGIGPRVGAGGRYPLPWGFNVFGQAGVSILVGEKEAESGFTNPADDSDNDPQAFVHRDFGVQVIPALDMRAGLGWEHTFGDWGKAFVDGGYEFQNYFNVVEQLTWGPAEATGAFGQTSGDLGIDGFFFRGGFRFNGP